MTVRHLPNWTVGLGSVESAPLIPVIGWEAMIVHHVLGIVSPLIWRDPKSYPI